MRRIAFSIRSAGTAWVSEGKNCLVKFETLDASVSALLDFRRAEGILSAT
jgi:hypothetical protein